MPDTETRVAVTCSLIPPVERRLAPVAEFRDVLPMGGMDNFVGEAGDLLPAIAYRDRLAPGELGLLSGTEVAADVLVLQMPRGDLVIVIEMQRTRDRAVKALQEQNTALRTSLDEGREVLTRLAAQMNEVQLDLSFGVEAYLDNVLIPDQLMHGFRTSMHQLVGLDTPLDNTSRMVERLGTVIQARAAALAAQEQAVRESRDRVLTTLLAIVSTLAVPGSLLLAYFGVSTNDVKAERSMFDPHYRAVYLLVTVPFLVLLVLSIVLRSRIRTRPVDLTVDRGTA